MKRVLLIVAALVLLASTALTVSRLTSTPAGAATAKIAVTGSLDAGMKTAQSAVPVMLQFKVANTGTAAYGPNGMYFMSFFVSSNASITSVECVQNNFTPSHYDIGGAKNACQLQALPAGATGRGAIDVYVNSTAPNPLTVQACVGATLNSKTYCATVKVPLFD
jgi:hypothetical protein